MEAVDLLPDGERAELERQAQPAIQTWSNTNVSEARRLLDRQLIRAILRHGVRVGDYSQIRDPIEREALRTFAAYCGGNPDSTKYREWVMWLARQSELEENRELENELLKLSGALEDQQNSEQFYNSHNKQVVTSALYKGLIEKLENEVVIHWFDEELFLSDNWSDLSPQSRRSELNLLKDDIARKIHRRLASRARENSQVQRSLTALSQRTEAVFHPLINELCNIDDPNIALPKIRRAAIGLSWMTLLNRDSIDDPKVQERLRKMGVLVTPEAPRIRASGAPRTQAEGAPQARGREEQTQIPEHTIQSQKVGIWQRIASLFKRWYGHERHMVSSHEHPAVVNNIPTPALKPSHAHAERIQHTTRGWALKQFLGLDPSTAAKWPDKAAEPHAAAAAPAKHEEKKHEGGEKKKAA